MRRGSHLSSQSPVVSIPCANHKGALQREPHLRGVSAVAEQLSNLAGAAGPPASCPPGASISDIQEGQAPPPTPDFDASIFKGGFGILL